MTKTSLLILNFSKKKIIADFKYKEMESSLEGFPESLKELQLQMNEAVKELHLQTEQFSQIEDDNKNLPATNTNNANDTSQIIDIKTYNSNEHNQPLANENNKKLCPKCNNKLIKAKPKKGKFAGRIVLACKNCNKIITLS